METERELQMTHLSGTEELAVRDEASFKMSHGLWPGDKHFHAQTSSSRHLSGGFPANVQH